MTIEKKELWPISKLHQWDKNPRDIKREDLDRLKSQIRELGEYKPLLIAPDGTVLGGNMRLRAMQEIRNSTTKEDEAYMLEHKGAFKQVWVSVVFPKNDEERIKYALSDNDRAGYYLEDDLKKIVSELNLTEEDIDSVFNNYKFDLGKQQDISELFETTKEEKTKDDVSVDVTKTTVSKKGEIYQCGIHRVMCGDSTNPDDVRTVLSGIDSVGMIFADPPYNVDLQYEEYDDNRSKEDYIEFCRKWFSIIKNYSNFIVITPGTVNLGMWDRIEPWKACAPWIKINAHNIGSVSYLRLWEPILFYGKTTKRRPNDIFEYVVNSELNIEHACPKPIELMTDILKSFEKQSVFDPFGGSGQTLLAAEILNMPCYMMEIDPKYVDVIRRRYWKFVNNKDETGWEEHTPQI